MGFGDDKDASLEAKNQGRGRILRQDSGKVVMLRTDENAGKARVKRLEAIEESCSVRKSGRTLRSLPVVSDGGETCPVEVTCKGGSFGDRVCRW